MDVVGLQLKAGVPAENLCRHRVNIQTPHKKAPADLEDFDFPVRREATMATASWN